MVISAWSYDGKVLDMLLKDLPICAALKAVLLIFRISSMMKSGGTRIMTSHMLSNFVLVVMFTNCFDD